MNGVHEWQERLEADFVPGIPVYVTRCVKCHTRLTPRTRSTICHDVPPRRDRVRSRRRCWWRLFRTNPTRNP